jgi:hypothetical protein
LAKRRIRTGSWTRNGDLRSFQRKNGITCYS